MQARAREDFGNVDSAADDEDEQQQGGGLPAGVAGAGAPVADICHAEEASQLLAALAGLYPDVKRLVEEREVPAVRSTPQCCIS
jgi:hypothetical protein